METNLIASARIDHRKLTRFVSLAFQKLGVPEEDAAIAANVLVMADLRGVDSHGVLRFSPRGWYVKALRDGIMNPEPNITIVSETPATALMDGDGGMGMVVGHRAMNLAIRKAESSGIGIVGVRNSRHFGMSAYYSMMALPRNMIGIAMTNAGKQVVPTFGREARFGTNPISLAAPADEERPFVLDMATTTVAAGKLEVAARWGKSIPHGWALDANGQVTEDPKVAQKARRLLPLGGTPEGSSYKGYGLAILVEILCGALTGTIAALTHPSYGVRGHFFGAIRIESFRPAEEFKTDMDMLLRELKSTPPIEGKDRVFVAGEIEFETAEERIKLGIPLHRSILDGLRQLSDELSVPYDLE